MARNVATVDSDRKCVSGLFGCSSLGLPISEADKRRILEEAAQGGTGVAEVARRYGIDRRVLRRWKQELAAVPAPTFVTVQIADAGTPTYAGPAAAGAVS